MACAEINALEMLSFYWGNMSDVEAEKLLEGKPDGTFMLRHDAVPTVSFRRFERTMHTRIVRRKSMLRFECNHGRGYASESIENLIAHYGVEKLPIL